MRKIFFYAFLFLPTWGYTQVYSPGYKTTVIITNDSSQAINNYQVLLVFNTEAQISAGHMKLDGGDIRFSADSCNPSSFYSYWIESGINTDSTKIWINIPQLAANTASNLLFWYGDSIAASMSNFNAVFPSAYISNGNDTVLSGIINSDWFQLDSGDVISVQANIPLQIKSRVIKINGVLQGSGMGYFAPLFIANGYGPGGGGMSNSAGGGGGSYAGLGGTGGFDAGDSPGTGGPIYGVNNDMNGLMGSGGGTTDNAIGGDGGGSIELNAEWVNINNKIEVNGLSGVGSIGRCGGGGSGGTILVVGNNVSIGNANVLNAKGGNGGSGSSAANDGGGGGSGGRIKIFHGSTWISSGSISLLGGSGGLYGSAGFGQDGALGSYFDSIITFPLVYISSLGPEMALRAEIIGLDSVYCLNKDSVELTAVPPGGVFSGPGVAANYFYPLNAGVGIHSISYLYTDPDGCGTLYDTVSVKVLNIPAFPGAANNGPLCEGTILNLGSTDSLATHIWAGPNGFTSTSQFPVFNNVSDLNNGNYTVTITLASGCTSTATTNLVVHPTPDFSVNNNGPVCIDTDLILIATGGLSYSWDGPNGFASALESPTLSQTQFISQGIYTVTITGIGGCEATTTTEVMVDGCYEDVEINPNQEISIYPNPTFAEVWIELPEQNFNGDINIEVFDVSGKKIIHRVIGSSNVRPLIDLASFASGVYILTITNGTLSKNFKVIRE